VTLYSDIDESCVDYSRETRTFNITFDTNLYEPPLKIVEHERRLEMEAKGAKKS